MLIRRLFGTEQILIQRPVTQKFSQDFLRLRPEIDAFVAPQMSRFVVLKFESPYIFRRPQIDASKANEFTGTRTTQQLQLYKRPHLTAYEWFDAEYLPLKNRLDGIGFFGCGSAPL